MLLSGMCRYYLLTEFTVLVMKISVEGKDFIPADPNVLENEVSVI